MKLLTDNREYHMNKIIHGDCLDKLKELEDNSIDSIVTDPPYEQDLWVNLGTAQE